ncbi:MAG: 50S ribosomal protein L6 [Longimicrobiales bacterium]|nr:50S ribosomal protein L6 [Longimicrobiales bacterium]
MSRIGKLPVTIPAGVEVKQDGGTLRAKGPKGELTLTVHPDMKVVMEGGEIRVDRPSEEKKHRSLHGLTRTLVANMLEGVSKGYSKTLEIVGVGYKAEAKGGGVTLTVGYSHIIEYKPVAGVKLTCPTATTIVISGADKQTVGHTAAVIRGFRPPEPYKGKGIRYQGEQVRRKAGKTAGA